MKRKTLKPIHANVVEVDMPDVLKSIRTMSLDEVKKIIDEREESEAYMIMDRERQLSALKVGNELKVHYIPNGLKDAFDMANRELGLGKYAAKPSEPYLWNAMLKDFIANETQVKIHLNNGVRLEGIINQQDQDALTLVRDNVEQLVMKHAIGTVMPVGGV